MDKFSKNYKLSFKANASIFVIFLTTLILAFVVAVAAKNTKNHNPASRHPITIPGLLKKSVLPPGIVYNRPATPRKNKPYSLTQAPPGINFNIVDEIPANNMKTSSSNNRSQIKTDFYAALKKLDKHQLYSLLAMFTILITLPFAVISVGQKAYFSSHAQTPSTPPITGPQNSVPGDANGDFHVDLVDYVFWLNNYGKTSHGPSTGDFNADNRVDLVDFVIWLNNYGKY